MGKEKEEPCSSQHVGVENFKEQINVRRIAGKQTTMNCLFTLKNWKKKTKRKSLFPFFVTDKIAGNVVRSNIQG